MNDPMLVWVTRPRPFNQISSDRLRHLGHRVIALPVLRIRRVRPEPPCSKAGALVFTSGHGVRHLDMLPQYRALPVFTIDDQVAQVARAAGYADIRSAGGRTEDLRRLLLSSLPPGCHVVHPGGREAPGGLISGLAGGPIGAEHRPVYEAVPTAADDLQTVAQCLQSVQAILVHSPRAAQEVARFLDRRSWSGTIFCLSRECADPLSRMADIRVRIAARPDELALVHLVMAHHRLRDEAAGTKAGAPWLRLVVSNEAPGLAARPNDPEPPDPVPPSAA